MDAAIFDLDDTLYDAQICMAAGEAVMMEAAAARLGVSAGTFLAAYHLGRRRSKELLTEGAAQHDRLLYLQHALEELGRPPFHDVVALHTAYWRGYLSAMRLFDGVRETLAALRAHGLRLALCTDMTAELQFQKIERLGLADAFDAIVTSEEVGVEKPDARMFRAVLVKVDAAPENAIMFGDSLEKDVRGAEAIGMRAAWFHAEDSRAACYQGYAGDRVLQLCGCV